MLYRRLRKIDELKMKSLVQNWCKSADIEINDLYEVEIVSQGQVNVTEYSGFDCNCSNVVWDGLFMVMIWICEVKYVERLRIINETIRRRI